MCCSHSCLCATPQVLSLWNDVPALWVVIERLLCSVTALTTLELPFPVSLHLCLHREAPGTVSFTELYLQYPARSLVHSAPPGMPSTVIEMN